MGELIWGFVIKSTPLGWYQCIKMSDDIEESDDEDGGEKSVSLAASLKKSSTLRKGN